MTIRELADKLDLNLLTPDADLEIEISTGYSCDLLSWVLAHGQPGMAWITVMTHMNVVAVAMLMDMACVIVPEGIVVEDASIEKAKTEGIAVFSSPQTAYELSGKMYALEVSVAQRE